MTRSTLRSLILGAVVTIAVSSLVPSQEAPPPPSPAPSPPQPAVDARVYYQRGMAAYQKKDYLAFLENMQQAVQLSPDNPELRFRLAAASALAGNKDDALAGLERLAKMKIYEDLGGSADFDSLKESPAFQSMMGTMKGLRTRIGTSQPAFHLAEKDLITEGLARDPVSGDFFVGSVHKRKIVRVTKRRKTSDFTAEGQDGLWSVLGMNVDAQRRLLWACSSAMPQMKDASPDELDRAALFAYNLDNGAFIAKYPLGGGGAGHNCNDLTVGARGDVFVSDAESGEILTLAPGSPELAVLVPAGTLRSPQGLAFSEQERYLFIADYTRGLWRLEMSSRSLSRLTHPDDVAVFGVDGLVYRKGTLIGVQNGVTLNRVAQFVLNAPMDAVQSGKILEMGNAQFDEPTLCVLNGKDLFYVANSQWSRFENDGTIFPLDRLAEPVILKLGLD